MTTGSTASVAQIMHDAGLAVHAAAAGHHYHGAFRIALGVLAVLVVAGMIVLVAHGRRPAGPRSTRLQRTTAHWVATLPSRRRTIAGAVCWLLGLEWFVGQAIAQAAWPFPYSLSQDYISALGVTRCGTYHFPGETSYICSPLHDVMNASFVLAGLLLAAGVVLLRDVWPRRPLTTAGLVLAALDGLGKIGAGLVPGNVNMPLHDAAALGILCGGIGALLLGSALWDVTRWQAVGFLAVGGGGTAGFIVMAAAPAHHLPAGAFERMAGWPLSLWLAALGLALIVSRKTAKDSPAGVSSQLAVPPPYCRKQRLGGGQPFLGCRSAVGW